MKCIAFLSDFGLKDGYVAQMKAAALNICDASFLDITHMVAPQNIYEAAFILRTTCPFLPRGTVVVAVVDPGVGTTRKGLVITTKNHILVGPDNGLLVPAAYQEGDFFVYEITNQKLFNRSVSSTFHGRDIFAPVAAHILNGVPFTDIGHRIADFVDLQFEDATFKDGSIVGKILYVDRFGNLITNISQQLIQEHIEYGKKLHIRTDAGILDVVYTPSYGFVPQGSFLMTIGSTGFLELAIHQGNAAATLNLKPNDAVHISLC